MSDGMPSSPESRVVPLRRGRAGAHGPAAAPPSVADLSRYEGRAEGDDYRHRMIVNVAAFLFLVALVGAGLWLVDTMAQMQRDQDCVLAGHRGCTPVDAGQSLR